MNFSSRANSLSPAEKVILWAQDLPNTVPQLVGEAERVERLLVGQEQNPQGPGADISQKVVEVLQSHLDGVYGLLDYAEDPCEELLEECLAALMQSHSLLTELEDDIDRVKECVPLVA
jgi:hypothetical protein